MSTHDDLVVRARQVFIGELIRSIRYWWWWHRSRDWPVAHGTVEVREFLRWSSNAGWTSIRYSYQAGEESFSGDARRGFISRKMDYAERDPTVVEFFKRFPAGAPVRVRFDPRRPSISVLDDTP
jgi:hypothetical protein